MHTKEYYLVIKNKILPVVTTWVNLESIALSEISQMERSTTIFHSCVKYRTESKEQTKQAHRDTHNRIEGRVKR